MRRAIRITAAACLLLGGFAAIAAADEPQPQGEWTAKRRPSKPATAESADGDGLAYRTSTQYEPPRQPPEVIRVGADAPGSSTVQASYEETADPARADHSQAYGKLVRLRGRNGAIRYAVVDHTGQPQCYLSKAPGVELARFVGQQVRVAGPDKSVAGSPVPRIAVEQIAVARRPGAPDRGVRHAMHVEDTSAEIIQGEAAADPGDAPPFEPGASADSMIEEVPPPRDIGRPAAMGNSITATPEIVPGEPRTSGPEIIVPEGAGEDFHGDFEAMDGEVYYPPEFGEEGGEILLDDSVEYAPRRLGRRHPGGPLHGILDRMNGAWFRADYLLWTTEGMNLSPLATTSPPGTAQGNAGVLGAGGTSVLFGDEEVYDESRSGGRIRAGVWLEPTYVWSVEGEFFSIEDSAIAFAASSNGTPILARPFFNVNTAQEASRLVAFPGVASGEIAIAGMTRFQGSAARLRMNAARANFAHDGGDTYWDLQWRESGLPGAAEFDCNQAGYRLDLVGGYRYLQLDDQLAIATNVESVAPAGTAMAIDSFEVENRFHGGEVGLLFEAYRRRWSLELLTKLAIGTTQEVVIIDGQTITVTNNTRTDTGGLLAQRTNIGRHRHNDFAVVPELGVTVGYQLTRHLRLNAGYSLVYWSRVARAGEQIDLDVNPTLIPPPGAPAGPARPNFHLVESDFWAHGLTAGLECRW